MEQIATITATASGRSKARIGDYMALARFDHMTKHVFIVPGLIIAAVLLRPPIDHFIGNLIPGLLSAVLIASANYIINEWLDREFDAYHPLKSKRAAVQAQLKPKLVYLQYLLFGASGLLFAAMVGGLFLPVAFAFLLSGVIYNVRPMRTKERAFVDVLSESINNPIRLTLGWAMVDPQTFPPSSLLLAYWMGGAFLMACKRLSEYRDVAADGNLDMLHRYRRSFRYYTAETLDVSCLLYANLAAFFVAVFLLKYRIEYILAFPFIALLFALYLWLSLRQASIAQRPERLFRSRRLMAAAAALTLVLAITSVVEIPGLKMLAQPNYIRLDSRTAMLTPDTAGAPVEAGGK